MAAARLLKMSSPSPMGLGFSGEIFSKSSMRCRSHSRQTMTCLGKAGGGERKPVAAKAAGFASDCVKTEKDLNISANTIVFDVLSHWMKFITKERPWRLHVQTSIEKAIIDCRFFAMLAVAGSLLGSVLCFVEGCLLMLESCLQYFQAISRMSEQGHVLLLLIESIDAFLVGTAMLIFGMALHVMFVGCKILKSKGSEHPGSNSTKNLNIEKIPSWIGMESIMRAKSKMGHALILILQVEVLEKCKNIPMSNGLDLACFGGAVLLSSASIILLSKIAPTHAQATR